MVRIEERRNFPEHIDSERTRVRALNDILFAHTASTEFGPVATTLAFYEWSRMDTSELMERMVKRLLGKKVFVSEKACFGQELVAALCQLTVCMTLQDRSVKIKSEEHLTALLLK